MPKQIYNQSDFSKGINGVDSPRDVLNDQVIQAKSVSFDEKGRIRMIGKAIESGISAAITADAFISGTSFFYFSHDYNMLDVSAGNSIIITTPIISDNGTDFFVIGNDRYIAIYDSTYVQNTSANNNGWMEDAIDMGASPGNVDAKMGFYFVDGALRAYNKFFDSAVYSRWHGHVYSTLFKDTTAELSMNGWYSTTTKLLPPVEVTTGTTYSDTIIGSESPGKTIIKDQAGAIAAASADTLTVHIDDVGSVGTWLGATYSFYISLIYDGSQESPVSLAPKDITVAADTSLYIGVTIVYQVLNEQARYFNNRITGARVYYTDPVDGDGVKYHLLDIDLAKGCKKYNEADWTEWTKDAASDTYESSSGLINSAAGSAGPWFEFEDMPKSITYDMLNGYGPNEITDAEFKAHTVFNNRIYIGNIKQDGKTYPDRLIKSPINFNGLAQYDTFPETHKMDVAVNDGDDITALEGFGDRLLVFKKNSIYVINVAQDGAEFVETKFANVGVKNDSQVTVTEFGIAWINDKGCYVYTGKDRPINLVDNLLDTYSSRRITPSMLWNIDEDKYPSIGYMTRNKKLLISLGMTDAHSNDAWIYDFTTKAWSFGGGVLGSWQYARSNFITDKSGAVFFGQLNNTALSLYRWEDAEQSHSEFSLWFKDLDFGQPNVRKKVYKAYLQFRSKGISNVKVHFCTNGNYSESLDFEDGTGITSNLLVESGSSGELITNGEFTTGSTEFTTVTSGVEFNGSDWSIMEASGGAGLAEIVSGQMGLQNVTGSDLVAFQAITTTNTITYEINFGFYKWMMGTGFPADDFAPPMICYIVNRYITHADVIDNSFNQGYKIVSQTGNYSFTFTAGTGIYAICFRALEYNTGDPSLIGSYTAPTGTANRIYFNNVSMSQEDEWTRAELKPNTSSDANNIYSFGLKLDVNSGSVPSGFEIDNLSVVYRTKNVK